MSIIKTCARLTVLLLLLAFTGMCTYGCRDTDQKNPDNATTSSAPSTTPDGAKPGIRSLMSFGVVTPADLSAGLGIYGSGVVRVGNPLVEAEIDTADLDSIRSGYTVRLSNRGKYVVLKGIVKSLPDAAGVAGQPTCNIVIELMPDEPSPTPVDPNPNQTPPDTTSDSIVSEDNQTQVGTATFTSGGLNDIESDTSVEIRINLPAKAGALYVKNDCIQKAADGRSYVWISLLPPDRITSPNDFVLREVFTGETDGRVSEITSGLNGDECLAMPFYY